MQIEGAGGSKGGIGRFFIGMIMMVAGGYLFLNAVQVINHFHLGYAFYSIGKMRLTSGMVLIPLIFGIGMIFYNAKNWMGWALSIASGVMFLYGIIASINFKLRTMTAFELIMILTLMIGGLGLFLSSLRNLDQEVS